MSPVVVGNDANVPRETSSAKTWRWLATIKFNWPRLSKRNIHPNVVEVERCRSRSTLLARPGTRGRAAASDQTQTAPVKRSGTDRVCTKRARCRGVLPRNRKRRSRLQEVVVAVVVVVDCWVVG